MNFDFDAVFNDMVIAMNNAVKDDVGDIKEYAKTVLKNEKDSLKELAEARKEGEISDAEFDRELKREKKVVEAELLTVQIITKAAAQKAVNAAIDVFVNAVNAMKILPV